MDGYELDAETTAQNYVAFCVGSPRLPLTSLAPKIANQTLLAASDGANEI